MTKRRTDSEKKAEDPKRFRLTLSAQRGDAEQDAVRKLRRVLKGLLRAHGLRCVMIEEMKCDG